MTLAERLRDANWELLGALTLCVVVILVEASIDPNGWLWAALVRSAPLVLVVNLAYAGIVLLLRRRESRRGRDDDPHG